MKRSRSMMKWAGSKQMMLEKLLKHVPKKGDVLVEPFVGSCSVALNTEYNSYLLNDANADLIELYKIAKDEPEWLIKELSVLFNQENNCAARFQQLKRVYNSCNDVRRRAVLLMYLSRYCFNSIVRYNGSGEFNVSFGSYKCPYLPVKEIYEFSEKMKNARFFSMDFQKFIDFAAQESGQKVCYIDPPYLPLPNGKSVFTQYVAEGFRLPRHKDINDSIVRNRQAFTKVLVSNHLSPYLPESYPDYIRKSFFDVQRTISCDVQNRASVREVLLHY